MIVKGAVKSYSNKDGKEICLWFGLEEDIVATIKTIKGSISNETVMLLEDSVLIRFQSAGFFSLVDRNLIISQLMIQLITEHAEFLEERLLHLQFSSSKERYKQLVQHFPDIIQRVSLTDIASFLGVSRETVSRIRAQK